MDTNQSRGIKPGAVLLLLAAACGGAGGIEPDRSTGGTNPGGGPIIAGGASPVSFFGNGGAASGPSIAGGASPVSFGTGGAASGPGITSSGGSGSSSGGGGAPVGCGGDTPLCQALESAFKSGGHDAFNCSDTGFGTWATATYVTPDQNDPNLQQCALRDGDIAYALVGCWAFHCAGDTTNCPSYSSTVTQSACAAEQLCGGTQFGNAVCLTQSAFPCSTLMSFSNGSCGN